MKIAIIGTGNMGSALARHLARYASLTICNRGKEKGQKIAKEIGAVWVDSPQEAVQEADYVLLSIKPKDLKGIEKKLFLTKKQTLISILAGVPLATLRKSFGIDPYIIRLMPNTALSVSKGVLGFSCEDALGDPIKKEVTQLFSELGLLLWIPESKMEAFAALAASSPAFVFLFIESMIESGIYLGLSMGESKEIVLSVLEGCIALLKHTLKHPAELKMEITSPGGTTIEGIRSLEEGGVRAAIFHALDATYQKSLQMGRESGEKTS